MNPSKPWKRKLEVSSFLPSKSMYLQHVNFNRPSRFVPRSTMSRDIIERGTNRLGLGSAKILLNVSVSLGLCSSFAWKRMIAVVSTINANRLYSTHLAYTTLVESNTLHHNYAIVVTNDSFPVKSQIFLHILPKKSQLGKQNLP